MEPDQNVDSKQKNVECRNKKTWSPKFCKIAA